MKSRLLLFTLALLLLIVPPTLAQGGRTVITASNAGSLDMLSRLGRGTADYVEWSADGSTILVGGSLGIWKYDATALDTQSEPELLSVGGKVDHFAVSPDGSTIAVSHTGSDLLEWWDYGTGTMINSADIINYSERLAYSADGSLIAMNSGSYGVVVYEGVNVFTEVTASLDADVDVLISPDGTQLVAANSSYDILVWDLVAGGDPITLDGHANSIEDMAISPDGSLLVSASSDDTFIVWDLQGGTLLETMTMPEDNFSARDVYAVTFSPDGSTLLSGHGSLIRVWDVASRVQSGEIVLTGTVDDIVYSPDGSQFVVTTGDASNAVQLFNADGTLVATTFFHNERIDAMTFSPDSGILAFNDTDGFLYMWDTASVEEITFNTRIEDGATFGLQNASNITYSSDGRYLGVVQSFSAELRDPVSGALIREFEVDGISEDIEFSPDNTLLAFVSSQGLYVFDVETGTQLAQFNDAYDWMNDVTWSPDQTMIATASSDSAVRVYTIGQ